MTFLEIFGCCHNVILAMSLTIIAHSQMEFSTILGKVDEQSNMVYTMMHLLLSDIMSSVHYDDNVIELISSQAITNMQLICMACDTFQTNYTNKDHVIHGRKYELICFELEVFCN